MINTNNVIEQNIVNLKNHTANESLNKALDLDSLFGHVPYIDFKTGFKSDLNLLITNSLNSIAEEDKIKTDHVIDIDNDSTPVVYIKDLAHFKLGVATTAIGNIDLYIVACDSDLSSIRLRKMSYESITKSMMVYGDDMPSCLFAKTFKIDNKKTNEPKFSGLKCTVNNDDLMCILDDLIERTLREIDIILYLEVYGNKCKTITGSHKFADIHKKVLTVFSNDILSYFIIDVCISCSLGDGLVTLANKQFFRSLRLVPNYTPLFSDAIMNYHIRTFNPLKGTLTGIGLRFKCFKLNFYSVFKYYLEAVDN